MYSVSNCMLIIIIIAGKFHEIVSLKLATRFWHLTLKKPGLLTPSHSWGGGFRPPSDLGRGATKNSEIRHVRRFSQYERADKIAI